MLDELRQIIAARSLGPAPLEALRERFADGWQPRRPADAVDFAEHFCRLVHDRLRHDDLPRTDHAAEPAEVANQGANALIEFIAHLPAALRDEIGALPQFRTEVLRPWDEPVTDAYVGLCNVVHDVWAHLLGPEQPADAGIARALLRLAPRHALDYGAGAGHVTLLLALNGIPTDVVEIDPVKRLFLQRRAARAGVARLVGPGLSRPSYDMVLALNVLDHLQAPPECLQQLAELLPPGGSLAIAAEFPQDGWHQGDPAAAETCAQLLADRFEPRRDHYGDGDLPVDWFDVFVKRDALHPGLGGALRCPRLHPRARWQAPADEANPATPGVLSATAFYTLPCALDGETARLCDAFDGRRPLAELADALELELDTLEGFCSFLHSRRLLTWHGHPAADRPHHSTNPAEVRTQVKVTGRART
jgi:SAM-dependent methyltransferase